MTNTRSPPPRSPSPRSPSPRSPSPRSPPLSPVKCHQPRRSSKRRSSKRRSSKRRSSKRVRGGHECDKGKRYYYYAPDNFERKLAYRMKKAYGKWPDNWDPCESCDQCTGTRHFNLPVLADCNQCRIKLKKELDAFASYIEKAKPHNWRNFMTQAETVKARMNQYARKLERGMRMYKQNPYWDQEAVIVDPAGNIVSVDA